MAEFLTGGVTGDTFEEGRVKINKFFSASTDYEIYQNGLDLKSALIGGRVAADVIYSGGTELSQLFDSMGSFRQEVVTGSNYILYRDYDGVGTITSTLYTTGTTFQFDVEFIPAIPGKIFKFDWFQQAKLTNPVSNGWQGEKAGEIQFNQFDQDSVSETFSILGNKIGHYQYLNDPAYSFSYVSSAMPDLSVSGVTGTFYPESGAGETFETGVTRVFVVQGILM